MGNLKDKIRQRIIKRYAIKTLKELDVGAIDIKSKTFWAGISAIGFGVTMIIQGDKETGIQSIIAGFGMIFIKHAIKKEK